MEQPTESRGGDDVVAEGGSVLDRDWAELSPEILTVIMSHLKVVDRLKTAQNVCSSWRKACRDPYLWRCIELRNLDFSFEEKAVDLSCGGLVSLRMEDFSTVRVLQHIADKSSQLKILRLIRCDFSDQEFSTAVQKFTFLEEIEISHCYMSKDALKLIDAGRNWPSLRTLKLNRRFKRRAPFEDDTEANVIAESMPSLQHLQIFGSKLSELGLQAILDGCRQLESLDLRNCFNLKMEGDLEKRCRQQIKDLKCPGDSVDDYPYGGGTPDYDSSSDSEDDFGNCPCCSFRD